jgi:type I restriction enzyme S subunit
MLPKTWRRSTLGEIARISSGGTPDRNKPEYWEGDVPWVTTGEIQFNTITDTAEKITSAGLQNSSAKLFPPGTLLMAMYGQGKTRGQVAKLGIGASTNQACAAIMLNEGNDPDFYFQYFSSQYEELRELGNAGTQKNLNGGILKGVMVPVPSGVEQRRIAQILATWDQAIIKAENFLKNSLKRKRGLTRDLVLGRTRFPQFNTPWQQLSFRDVLKEVKRRVDWDDEQAYPLISVRRRSEGAFHRETLNGSEILTKKLNYAYEGEFLLSKMQVVHGAMAVVPAALDGMFVSDSYLTFKSADEDRFDINFIGWLSTTQKMYKAVRRCSYGVHIEKMTFDLDMFLGEKLLIPTTREEQRLICDVLERAQAEIKAASDHLEQLKREKAALMSQLLTGKLRVKMPDVEEETQA